MSELKTLGVRGYRLLTFEVTLPFFDKAGTAGKSREGWAGKKTAKRALSLERLAVGQEREMRDGYKS